MRRAPVRDLDRLLAEADPLPRPGEWVFTTAAELPAGATPVMSFAEDEGLTAVLDRGAADALGLAYGAPMAWITLRVHSALDAVGLTAAVSGALAAEGIACNVVAAYHHDHVFVPLADAGRAVDAIRALAPLGEA